MVESTQHLEEEAIQAVSIDFHTLWKQELLRSGVKLDLKVATSLLVYNMLQDMRHLVILDFRSKENFNQSHIRKASNVDIENYRKVLVQQF